MFKNMSVDIAHEYFTWKLVQDVAEEHGFFQQENVDPDFDYFAPGTQDFSEMGDNAKDADWWEDLDNQGQTHGVCEWNAVQESSETDRQIVGSYSEWDRVLFSSVDSGTTTLEDLRNSSIGINKYATSFYSIREMLQSEGFDDDEIVLEHIGSAEERFEAVKNGEVDSIGVLEPYVTLGRYDDELEEVYEGPCRAALVAPPEADPEQVTAFRNALNRAVEEINNNLETYRDQYIDLLEAEAEDDPETFADVDIDELREEFELRNFLPVRAPDEERIENTAEWMDDAGYVEDQDDIETIEGDQKEAPASD
jgi:ABC-type nitrate/sulfonate/bicarbonate transport systems, periplasmic components